MIRFFEGLSKFWATFMEYNKALDTTLFIVLTFWTLNKILNLLQNGKLTDDATQILTDYASLFSHVLSAIVGALFMKAAMDSKNGNGVQK